MALGAIVVSGILLFVLGTVRLGVLARPLFNLCSTRHAGSHRYYHPGQAKPCDDWYAKPRSASPIPLLVEFFSSLQDLLWADTAHLRSAIVGIGSLLFLIGFSQIRARWMHAIPAPLWVVVLAVLTQIIGTNVTGESFFGPKYLVNIPADWMSAWRLPDFSGIQSGCILRVRPSP